MDAPPEDPPKARPRSAILRRAATSPDVCTNGGTFIPRWAFTSSIEPVTVVRSFDMDFCVERLVSLLDKDIKKGHASIGAIFYGEVKEMHSAGHYPTTFPTLTWDC
ncbi:hypothetical protein E2C01_037452 [Portunus trituberculatus]|uniref:Uncharacterized protein n=1 Tax=Portunus trituberculatus TaxID=210409 RepID=A0A5B7F866_PORTR|nr:hypothetical protein [Portunus trituberculatus]